MSAADAVALVMVTADDRFPVAVDVELGAPAAVARAVLEALAVPPAVTDADGVWCTIDTPLGRIRARGLRLERPDGEPLPVVLAVRPGHEGHQVLLTKSIDLRRQVRA